MLVKFITVGVCRFAACRLLNDIPLYEFTVIYPLYCR